MRPLGGPLKVGGARLQPCQPSGKSGPVHGDGEIGFDEGFAKLRRPLVCLPKSFLSINLPDAVLFRSRRTTSPGSFRQRHRRPARRRSATLSQTSTSDARQQPPDDDAPVLRSSRRCRHAAVSKDAIPGWQPAVLRLSARLVGRHAAADDRLVGSVSGRPRRQSDKHCTQLRLLRSHASRRLCRGVVHQPGLSVQRVVVKNVTHELTSCITVRILT